MEKLKMILCGLALMTGIQCFAQTETLKVWMDDAIVTADGTSITKLSVYENDEVDYTAFSMSLVVPYGVKVAQVKSGREYVNDIALSERAASTHSIACNLSEDGRTIKIISSSTQKDNFYPDDESGNLIDEIFQIGLIADPSLANGDYDIEIVDCKFVLKSAAASQPQEAVTAKLTIQGGTDSSKINYMLDDAGCGTIILPFEAQIPEGIKVYRCHTIDNNIVVPEEQNVIPANVPLLVLGTPGTYSFSGIATQSKDSYSDGDFVGVYSDRAITSGYILKAVDGVTGFYGVDSETGAEISTYGCYMQAIDGIPNLSIDFTTTGLDNIRANDGKAGSFYDMLGRKVNAISGKGVYVRRGEKIIVK